MRTLVLCAGLMLLGLAAGPVWGQEDSSNEIYRAPDERMFRDPSEVLLEFFDRNELALSYYRLCVNNGLYPPEEFMHNSTYVSLKLQEALAQAYPDKTTKDIEDYIVKRGSYLQRKNSQRAYDDGCKAKWAEEGKSHFDLVNSLKTEVLDSYIQRLIKNAEGG